MAIKKKIEQFISLIKEKKFIESENLLQTVLDDETVDYNKLVNSSLILVKEKYYNESILLLKKAIKINPKKNDAHINIGNIYIILKEYIKGLEYLNFAYKNDPLNINIINSLTYLNFELKENSKALILINSGLKINEKNYFLLNLKGKIYIEQNLVEEGIICLVKSISVKNDYWNSYENLLFILESTNNLKSFKKYIKLAKLNLPNNIFLRFFEAQLFFREKKFDTTIKFLKEIDLEKQLSDFPDYLILYYDLLGKSFEKIKNYKSSYHYVNLRNILRKNKKENKKFNKKIILDLISDYKRYFVEKNINKNKISLPKEKDVISPVFLIGFPRSGTTLLDSILRGHSKIEVLEEKPFVSIIRDNFFISNNNLINSLEKLDQKKIISTQAEYLSLLNLENVSISDNNILIDKFPLNIIEIGFIQKIFPNSKFIIALRHPCDVVLSCFTSNFKINEGMANFYDLESAANLYNEVFLLFEHYRKFLDINCFIIKYEDVVLDFQSQISNLIDFLDLKWEYNLNNFNNTAVNRKKINTPSYSQVTQPLYSTSINRWKNFKEIQNVYPILEKWIKEFNY